VASPGIATSGIRAGLPQQSERWKASPVQQQLTDGHRLLLSLAERREILPDRIVQIDLLLVIQSHQRSGGGNPFRKGSEVEKRGCLDLA
jgi:hypothetical protein